MWVVVVVLVVVTGENKVNSYSNQLKFGVELRGGGAVSKKMEKAKA